MDFFSKGHMTAFFRFCGKVPEVIDRFMMSWRGLLIFMSVDLVGKDLVGRWLVLQRLVFWLLREG